MAIDTNTVTLGSSMPTKTSFAARADDPSAESSQAAQTQSAGASGPEPGSTSQASGSDQTNSTDAGSTSGQKSAGPSVQTRNAQTQTRSATNAARSRTRAANSASGPTGSVPQDIASESSADFSAVMASALQRGTASTTEVSLTAAPLAASNDPATGKAAAQPAAATPADASAWIAQSLLPSVSATPIVTKAAAASGDDPASAASVAIAAGSNVLTARTLAQVAARNVLGAAPPPANAAMTALAAPPAPAANPAPSDNAALSAASANSLNALADVQKLLVGATADSADGDSDATPATPKTHALTDAGPSDVGEAAAALQAASLSRTAGSVGTATLTIHAPVGSAAFANEVSAKASSLAQSGITQAQLQLNPADMGPVQVHITMQAGQASVWFGATHADTRAALEQSLPRLRELFAGAGMPLTDSGVFREPPPQQQAPSTPGSANTRDTLSDAASSPTVTQVSKIRLSLLDTYA